VLNHFGEGVGLQITKIWYEKNPFDIVIKPKLMNSKTFEIKFVPIAFG
jgi:hypothetical protein